MFNNELKKNALEELKRTKSRHDSQLDSTVKMVEKFHNSKLAARDIAQHVAAHLETLSGVPKEYAKEISDIKINLQDFTTEVDRLERDFDDNNGGSITGAVLLLLQFFQTKNDTTHTTILDEHIRPQT